MFDDLRATLGRNGLVRPRHDRMIAGVCAGLGRRLGLDPVPARWLFVIVLFLLPGSQLLVYPVLWILMPEEQTGPGGTPPGGGYSAR